MIITTIYVMDAHAIVRVMVGFDACLILIYKYARNSAKDPFKIYSSDLKLVISGLDVDVRHYTNKEVCHPLEDLLGYLNAEEFEGEGALAFDWEKFEEELQDSIKHK